MSKVLVVYVRTLGDPAVALVDKEALAGYPLEEMNNCDVNGYDISDHVRDCMCELGKRLGVVPDHADGPSVMVADLMDARILSFPITADEVEVLFCSWMM